MTDNVEAQSDAVSEFESESGESMHLHRPKPLHGWRELLLEIGVIVVGILIAIGLEQTVEFLHHRFERNQLETELRRDGEANSGYIKKDIATAQTILDWAIGQASTLELAGPTGALRLRRMPGEFIGALDAGIWPSAKASGLTNLLPASAQNWLDYLNDVKTDTFDSSASAAGQLALAYAAFDQLIIGQAKESSADELDLSALSPSQRLIAVDRLRAIAEQARSVLRHLLIYDAGNDYILSTALDRLDTPEGAKRYLEIYREERNSHPIANYPFVAP